MLYTERVTLVQPVAGRLGTGYPVRQTSTGPHRDPSNPRQDALGHVRAELAALREREEGLKTELLERGVARADGRLFRAVVSKAVSWRLDTARLKTEFGEDWVTARSKPVSSTSVRVSAHEEAQIRRTP